MFRIGDNWSLSGAPFSCLPGAGQSLSFYAESVYLQCLGAAGIAFGDERDELCYRHPILAAAVAPAQRNSLPFSHAACAARP